MYDILPDPFEPFSAASGGWTFMVGSMMGPGIFILLLTGEVGTELGAELGVELGADPGAEGGSLLSDPRHHAGDNNAL